MSARPHVFIATPCYGGLVTQGYMESVIALMTVAGGHGFDLTLGLLGHDALITRSRNTLLARFLSVPGATHILFIDADIAFEAEQVARMLRLGEDVVAGMYPLKSMHWGITTQANLMRGEPPATAALLYVGVLCGGDERARREGFATGTYAGTGFLLITRRAIERMIAAYPETRYGAIHAYPPPPNGPETHYALFDCVIDPETGHYLSEDFTFCRRWRAIGGRVWLDTEGRLTHAGGHEFRGDPRRRYGG